ncbi:hypothetical protein ACFLQ8_01220 [Candidatus Auribacterota bacterium]
MRSAFLPAFSEKIKFSGVDLNGSNELRFTPGGIPVDINNEKLGSKGTVTMENSSGNVKISVLPLTGLLSSEIKMKEKRGQ